MNANDQKALEKEMSRQAAIERAVRDHDPVHLKKVADRLFKIAGWFKHCNSFGPGLIKGDRIGIHMTHVTEEDRTMLVDHLIANGHLTPGPDGLYFFEGVLVEFVVIGTITPL